MHPLLNIAIQASREAGNLIIRYYGISFNIDYKTDNYNYYYKIDQIAELLIIKIIKKYYPQHTIIGKYNNEFINKDNNIKWIINAINGISNIMKHFPYFAISIAIQIKERTEISVIFDPIRNELFTALRGYGARLNGYRLHGSNINNINKAILIINFSLNKEKYTFNNIRLANKLLIKCMEIRCTGSLALDLAYLATGRVDGIFGININLKNLISGALLVKESGNIITDYFGKHYCHLSGIIIIGNKYIVKSMISVITSE